MKTKNKFKFILSLTLLLVATVCFSQNNKFRVTLDAGHGAHDPGAKYNGHYEKNITLAIVLKIGAILEKNPNIDVTYTRKTDLFIDLIERANIANRANSNIFVSIHCNANKNTSADGTESYVMGMSKNASNLEAAKKENSVITLEKNYKQKYEGFDPSQPESFLGMIGMQEEFLENSIVLAGKIQDQFVSLGKKSRGEGVKQAPYMVLHKAYMPRVLVETGFISNPTEGAKLDSEEGQQEIAEAVAKAIISYKKEYFDGGTNDVNNDKPVKPAVPEPKKVDSIVKPVVKTDKNSVVFKVQLSTSTKELENIPSNFNGLNYISVIKEKKNYKYYYGETNDYNDAVNLLKMAKAKGYFSAYVVAFKNGKNISIKEATKR